MRSVALLLGFSALCACGGNEFSDGSSGGAAGAVSSSGGSTSTGGASGGSGHGGSTTGGTGNSTTGGGSSTGGSAGAGNAGTGGGSAGTGGGSSTGIEPLYLIWQPAPATAEITIVDAADGSVKGSKTLTNDTQYTNFIDFAALGDGTFRALWQDNVGETLWVLDSNFEQTNTVSYTRDTNAITLTYVKRPDGTGRLGRWAEAMYQTSVWFIPLATDDKLETNATFDIIGQGLDWTPKQYFPMQDGTARLLWWYQTGFELWTLDAADAVTEEVIAPATMFDYVAESYSNDENGAVRMGWAKSTDASRAALCTYASDDDLDVFPTEAGWGPGKCAYYEEDAGSAFRGHVIVQN